MCQKTQTETHQSAHQPHHTYVHTHIHLLLLFTEKACFSLGLVN